MNRSNVGNVITNGTQILSVGATTASRVLGRADKTLNNLTKEEQEMYDKMQGDKKREQIKSFYNKTDNAFRRLSDDEQSEYRDYQADLMRKQMSKFEEEENQSVDKIMGESGLSIENFLPNTEQAKELGVSVNNNISYIKKREYLRDNKGRFISNKQQKEEVKSDANV